MKPASRLQYLGHLRDLRSREANRLSAGRGMRHSLSPCYAVCLSAGFGFATCSRCLGALSRGQPLDPRLGVDSFSEVWFGLTPKGQNANRRLGSEVDGNFKAHL